MTATTWKIDPAHTDILFSAKHMMVTTVRGKFTDVEGTLDPRRGRPGHASRGSVHRRPASLNTAVEQRDGHLRSADFFDAEQLPGHHVRLDRASSRKRGNDYAVTGDLTIRDVDQARHVRRRVPRHLPRASRAAAAPASTRTTKLNREDWGLNWNVALETGGWLVGKEIKLEIDLGGRGRRRGDRRRTSRAPPRPDPARACSPRGPLGAPTATPTGASRVRRPPAQHRPVPSGTDPPRGSRHARVRRRGARARFPALSIEHDGRPIALFDGPGGTQVPDSVIEAVAATTATSNANHGGPFLTSERSDAMLDEAHAALADLLNAARPVRDQVRREHDDAHDARRRSITATLAPGDEIVVTGPRPRGERRAVAERRRGPRAHRPHRRTSGPTTCTLDVEALDAILHGRAEARRVRLGVERRGHDQPGRRARAARPRGGRADLRRRGPRGARTSRSTSRRSAPTSSPARSTSSSGPTSGVLYGRADVARRAADVQAPARGRTGSRPGPLNHEGIAGVARRGRVHRRGRGSGTAAPFAAAFPGMTGRGCRRTRAWPRSAPTRWTLFERLLAGLEAIPGLRASAGITDRARFAERTPTAAVTFAGITPRGGRRRRSARGASPPGGATSTPPA